MKAKLIIANSETNSDLYYATRFLVPDDFIYLEIGNRKIIYVSDLEYSRAVLEATVDEVVNISSCPAKYKSMLAWVIARHNLKEVLVPENFSIGYAEALRKMRIKIEVKFGMFFEERNIKNDEEVRAIKATQKVNEKAMECAINAIRQSKIRKDKKLEYKGKILTSEFLKEIIGIEFLKGGCKSQDEIVSCGKDSALPHKEGNGPLYADKPIVIDIYPRSYKSRYFADMTRTVVRGKASEEIKKIYNTVLEGQKLAIKNVKAGTEASCVENCVREYFDNKEYKTEFGDNPQGFIHALGHGVGLDLHERPSVNFRNNQQLKEGNIITIEPGLYYPKIGGVRIEDMVLVEKDGCTNLTKFPKVLEI